MVRVMQSGGNVQGFHHALWMVIVFMLTLLFITQLIGYVTDGVVNESVITVSQCWSHMLSSREFFQLSMHFVMLVLCQKSPMGVIVLHSRYLFFSHKIGNGYLHRIYLVSGVIWTGYGKKVWDFVWTVSCSSTITNSIHHPDVKKKTN